MMKRAPIFLLLIALLLGVRAEPSFAQEKGEETPADATMEDLEKELYSTLQSIKGHFEDVQNRLDEAGVDRDPGVDEAIKELSKEQQSLMDTFKGLVVVLLKLHPKDESYTEQSTTSFEDVEDEFNQAIEEMDKYIAEREAYWENTKADPEVMIEEELKRMQEEEALLEAILDPLIKSLEDSWTEVVGGWGKQLEEWEKTVRDLAETEGE